MFKTVQAFDCTEERRPHDLFIFTIADFDDSGFALDVHAIEATEDGFTDPGQFSSEAKEDDCDIDVLHLVLDLLGICIVSRWSEYKAECALLV